VRREKGVGKKGHNISFKGDLQEEVKRYRLKSRGKKGVSHNGVELWGGEKICCVKKN